MKSKKRGKLLLGILFAIFIITILINISLFNFPLKIIPLTTFSVSQADVGFNISVSKGIVVYRDAFDGNTTDFTIGGNAALEVLENMVLEVSNYGKIVFNETINLTQDAVSNTSNEYNRYIDIDNNLQISNNYLISTADLSSLNKSATVYFYNTSFTSPKILRNGVDCPANVCTIISNSGGTLVFNITGFALSVFTSYSAVETATTTIFVGGGGGRRTIVTTPNFKVDRELIMVVSKQGETFKTMFKITNLKDKKLDIKINSSLNRFIIFSEKDFFLDAKEEKEIFITFYATENVEPGVYVGIISITDGGTIKKIQVIFEIESKKVLFDVILEIPPKYKKLFPGEDLYLNLRLFNLGDFRKADVFVKYLIKDFEGNIILTQEDLVTVNIQISLSKIIRLPYDLKAGDYIAIAEVRYLDSIGISTTVFEIKEISLWKRYQLYIILFVILFLILLVILLILLVKKKSRRKTKENSSKKLVRKKLHLKGIRKT